MGGPSSVANAAVEVQGRSVFTTVPRGRTAANGPLVIASWSVAPGHKDVTIGSKIILTPPSVKDSMFDRGTIQPKPQSCGAATN